jgi:hypothetical protein
MADIHAATSTYDTGTNDTYTAVQDMVDDVLDNHQNGPASAIIAIETILGTGTTLKGSAADLVARLAVALESSGKIKDFSATTKTTFPPTTAEGCLGDVTANYTASQLVRKHATLEKIESTGYTVPGASGVVVSEGDTQTLTNKTLTTPTINSPTIVTPTIASFTNATHDHSNAAGGGNISASAIPSSTIVRSHLSTAVGGISGTANMPISVTMDAYSFFPMVHSNDATVSMHNHTTDGASADAPRFILEADDSLGGIISYDVDWRYISA